MFRRLRKTKTLQRYLLYYFVSSIIPVFILGTYFLYMNTLRTNDDTEKSMLLKLSQVQNRIDYGIKEMETVSLHFSSKIGMVEEYRKNGTVGFSQQLKLYKDNAGFASDVLLYICGDSVFFNSEGEMSYQDLEEYVGQDNNLTMSRFFSVINNPYVTAIPLVRPYPDNNMQSNLIVYKFPIPALESSPTASILFIIRAEDILDKIINYIGEFSGYAFIYDNNLRPIYKYDNYKNLDTDTIASDMAKLKGGGISVHKYGSQKFVSMRMVSENLGFNYVVSIPYDEFFHKTQKNFKTFMYLIAATVALLLVISAVLAARNYKPIRKLLEFISVSSGNEVQIENLTNIDEFDRLKNVYRNMSSKNTELLNQVSNQKEYVKETSLTKLLQGDIKDINSYLSYSEICFQQEYFFVMAVMFRNASEKLENIEKALYLVEEIHFENAHAYSVELFNDKIIAVIVNSDKILDIMERSAIGSKMHNMFKDNGYNDVVIGIGNSYTGLEKVSYSFLESVTAIKTFNDNDQPPIKLFIDKEPVGTGKIFSIVNDRSAYIKGLLDGNEEIVLGELDHMVREITDESNSFLIMQYLCIDIINSTVKTARILNIDISQVDIDNILFFTTVGEFRIKTELLIRLICDRVKDDQKKTNETSHEDIIEYVRNSFTSYDISLEYVSDLFKVSPSYLSSFFKKRTGYSFLQYITILRMDYIKEQLRTTELQINDIVKSAGYIDAANFIRRFKSIEGMTPGQYRKVTKLASQ